MSERTDLVQATQRAARQISRISGPQFEAGNKALLCQTARNFAHRSLLQAGLQPVNFEVLVKEPDSFWNGGTRAVQVTIKQKFAQSLAGAQSIHIFKAGYLAQSTFVFEHDVQLNGACPV